MLPPLRHVAASCCCCCRQEGDDDSHQWQKTLYKKIGSRKAGDEASEPSELDLQSSVNTVLAMAKVLHGLHLVSATQPSPAVTCFTLIFDVHVRVHVDVHVHTCT